MPNLFDSYSEWISAYRKEHCTTESEIKIGNVWTPINLTRSANDTETNPDGQKIQTQHVNFIVAKSDLDTLGVQITRGLQIRFKGHIFEVSLNKGRLWDWNDPGHVDV